MWLVMVPLAHLALLHFIACQCSAVTSRHISWSVQMLIGTSIFYANISASSIIGARSCSSLGGKPKSHTSICVSWCD